MKEPKYKIGDEVYILDYAKIEKRVVTGVLKLTIGGQPSYKFFLDEHNKVKEYGWVDDSKLFPTREALIDSL